MKFPVTIFTGNIEYLESKRINLKSNHFIDLISKNEINVVFKSYKEKSTIKQNKKYYLYIVKEGFCFVTEGYAFKDYEEYYNTQKFAEKAGFKYLSTYIKAKEFGIDNITDYKKFKASSFYENNLIDKESFSDYLIFKKGGFNKIKDYDDAKNYGITSQCFL